MTDDNREEEIHYELPYTQKLQEPFEVGEGKLVSELVWKNRLQAAMVENMPIGGREFLQSKHFLPIISGMTGESPIVIRKMGYADYAESIGIASYFLEGGQGTQKADP